MFFFLSWKWTKSRAWGKTVKHPQQHCQLKHNRQRRNEAVGCIRFGAWWDCVLIRRNHLLCSFLRKPPYMVKIQAPVHLLLGCIMKVHSASKIYFCTSSHRLTRYGLPLKRGNDIFVVTRNKLCSSVGRVSSALPRPVEPERHDGCLYSLLSVKRNIWAWLAPQLYTKILGFIIIIIIIMSGWS